MYIPVDVRKTFEQSLRETLQELEELEKTYRSLCTYGDKFGFDDSTQGELQDIVDRAKILLGSRNIYKEILGQSV